MGYIEEKSVITKVLDNKLPIKVGDVVLAVDGVDGKWIGVGVVTDLNG